MLQIGGRLCYRKGVGKVKENYELKVISRYQLEGHWLAAVGMMLIYGIIISLSTFVPIALLVLGGPLELGFTGYYMRMSHGKAVKLENLFDGFKQFGSSFLLWLLEWIFLTLWTCLLIVPGIVKSFSYSMAFYILRDNPGIGAAEAITRSRKMMDGYKIQLFKLYLSFIGWALLCCLSLGIGFLWLIPYIKLSEADFYRYLKESQSLEVSDSVS